MFKEVEMRTVQDILENMEELINGQKKEIASLKEQLINKECNCCGGSDADVNKYISKLKKQLKREQECTDFYANKKNINQMCNGTGDDYEEIDGVFHGGKRARATQARREKWFLTTT
jgi:hypothetical protein